MSSVTFTMADEDALQKCVTKFMLNTCRCKTVTSSDVYNIFIRVSTRNLFSHRPTTADADTLFTSGSSAEFYIKPLLSCIGDVDYMLCNDEHLAVPAGHTPPTELPTQYKDGVAVCEILDSRQPGYVYLQVSYLLRKNDRGLYIAEKIENGPTLLKRCFGLMTDPSEILKSKSQVAFQFMERFSEEVRAGIRNSRLQSFVFDTLPHQLHGPAFSSRRHERQPAVQYENNRALFEASNTPGTELFHCLRSNTSFNFDQVLCIRCPRWPPQADNWPTRSRSHSWPDTTTISMIFNNGCDVVGAVHPSCKHDGWMNEYQWRLSFSRAEVMLLNSWTKVQQIIYHMLRFFVKHEITSDKEPDHPTLSNYHIKTLMLWECEQTPQSWWSAENSLVNICSSLLHKLSGWVEHKCCHHYFVSHANLLDHFTEDSSLVICNRLNQTADAPFLLTWFLQNYIGKCIQCYLEDMLVEEACNSNKVAEVVDAVVDRKLKKLLIEFFEEHQLTESSILSVIHLFPINPNWISAFLEELQKVDMRFTDYFTAVICLHVAYKTSLYSFTEDRLDLLWASFDFSSPSVVGDVETDMFESRGLLSLTKAIKLATLSTVRSNSMEMLHNEMSKAYLHHSLTCGPKYSNCVARVLLTVLYYKSGRYHEAIEHCKQVLHQSDPEQYGLRSIGAEYLPQVDENVDRVCGLILFYQYFQKNKLHSDELPQSESAFAFTTELLARYLYSRCSTELDAKCTEVINYRKHLFNTKRLLLGDVLLFKVMEIQEEEVKDRPDAADAAAAVNNDCISMDTTLLVTSLELVALEKLAAAREVIVRELHCEKLPVLNEFEALYAYKCGLFEDCLAMCRRYVIMVLDADCWRHQVYGVAMPEFLCLLDGDLVSLFGVIRLLHPSLLITAIELPGYATLTLLAFCLYLMAECQKKLHHDSFDDTLQLIRFVHDEIYPEDDKNSVLDRLVLKLTYRSMKLYDTTEPTGADESTL